MGTLKKRTSHQYEEMGRLTQGLLHNINNSLGSIIGFSEFLAEDLDKNSPHHVFAENIKSASEHIKDLIRQMWTLNAISEMSYNEVTDQVDISEIIETQLLAMSEPLFKNMKISVEFDIEDSVTDTKIIGFHGYLTQMFLELVSNAIESFEEQTDTHKPKMISVTLSKPQHAPEYLCMKISDTGDGMEPEILEQCRSPFFSHRDASEHHGLGLTIVDSILKSSGGVMDISSEAGIGSTISINLRQNVS
ncbi:MAG: HAMP domain-containing sensor histidine kinase [Pseudobdellovibrionaceae bacterium]|jgi:signal transduction histidine kinase|nr:HAMP domain-containing sensor histidine kinase [Pseudobdellovibrionaceae bacterium]